MTLSLQTKLINCVCARFERPERPAEYSPRQSEAASWDNEQSKITVLKGRDNSCRVALPGRFVAPLQGADICRGTPTQGGALGCILPRLQRAGNTVVLRQVRSNVFYR